jgi:hypothetical protein
MRSGTSGAPLRGTPLRRNRLRAQCGFRSTSYVFELLWAALLLGSEEHLAWWQARRLTFGGQGRCGCWPNASPVRSLRSLRAPLSAPPFLRLTLALLRGPAQRGLGTVYSRIMSVPRACAIHSELQQSFGDVSGTKSPPAVWFARGKGRNAHQSFSRRKRQ